MSTFIVGDLNQADELAPASMTNVVGGLTRQAAVLEAYRVADRIELELIDVEPEVYVPMKL